jgi:hypothetical protein
MGKRSAEETNVLESEGEREGGRERDGERGEMELRGTPYVQRKHTQTTE